METSSNIRAVIADDEALGRERVRSMLSRRTDVEIVAECSDGRATVNTIRTERPDLLFLDVQMPELDGFGVIDEVGADNMPATVFITAYDEYAIRAFDVQAVDYLLKPFDAERFDRAVNRALDRHRKQKTDSTLATLTEEVRHSRMHPDHIAVKSRGRIDLIKVESIDWISAAGNYVELHAGSDVHLIRQTMSAMEERLDKDMFMRIHRSTIVKIDQIEDIRTMFKGEHEVRLKDGTRLTLSRGYKDRLDALLP